MININWYKLAHERIKAVYGDDYILFSGLVASISPRFDVKRNLRTAKEVYIEFKKSPCDFLLYVTFNKPEFLKRFKILKAHYDNILLCFSAYMVNEEKNLKLSGNKVNSFFKNLCGDYNAVTLDIWMMKALNFKKYFMNNSDYNKLSKRIITRAKKENLHPAEYQAKIWIEYRMKNGRKPIFLHDKI